MMHQKYMMIQHQLEIFTHNICVIMILVISVNWLVNMISSTSYRCHKIIMNMVLTYNANLIGMVIDINNIITIDDVDLNDDNTNQTTNDTIYIGWNKNIVPNCTQTIIICALESNCNDNWYYDAHDTILFNTFKKYYNCAARAIESLSDQFKTSGPSTFKMDWYPGDADSDSISHDGFYNLFLILSNVMSDISDVYSVKSLHDTGYNIACFMTLVLQFQQLNILKPKQFELMSFTGFNAIWEQRGILNNEFFFLMVMDG